MFAGELENHDAFSKHFERQIELYQQVSIISLLDLYGKEKVMADAFLLHTVKFNSEVMQYVAFDFHEYWWELQLVVMWQTIMRLVIDRVP